MRKKKLSGNSDYAKEIGKTVIPKVVGLSIGIGAAYFLLVRPILTSTGLIKSSEDKKRDEVEAQYGTAVTSPFNPTYYKTAGSGALLLTRATAENFANIIWDSIDFWDDDENDIYAVFRQLKAKTQVSWLADVFFQLYTADLYQFLRGHLSDSEMDVIHGIVNNLK